MRVAVRVVTGIIAHTPLDRAQSGGYYYNETFLIEGFRTSSLDRRSDVLFRLPMRQVDEARKVLSL